MQIEVHEDKRIVCVWLTKSDSDDSEIKALLNPLYKQYRALKYTVVIFHSGDQKLCQLTGDLLKYNRRLSAQREVHSEQINI